MSFSLDTFIDAALVSRCTHDVYDLVPRICNGGALPTSSQMFLLHDLSLSILYRVINTLTVRFTLWFWPLFAPISYLDMVSVTYWYFCRPGSVFRSLNLMLQVNVWLESAITLSKEVFSIHNCTSFGHFFTVTRLLWLYAQLQIVNGL